MDKASVTIWMAAAFVAIVGLDVYLALDDKRGNTYSEIIRKAGKAWPFTRLLMAVSMGVLLGHWYW